MSLSALPVRGQRRGAERRRHAQHAVVAVGQRQLERLDPPPDALGELVGALEVGLRQRDGHLLAAVAGGLVDVTRGLAQDAGDLAQHHVALQVAVGVVDLLEVVDVEHDQAELVVVAAGALDLRRHDLLEAAVVEQPGELVGDRLAGDRLVQVDVLDRDRGLVGEVGEQLALAGGERLVLARDGDDADDAAALLRRAERRGERAGAAELDLRHLAGVDHRRLGGVQRAGEGLRLAGAGDLGAAGPGCCGASRRGRRPRRCRRPRSGRRSRAGRPGRGRG